MYLVDRTPSLLEATDTVIRLTANGEPPPPTQS